MSGQIKIFRTEEDCGKNSPMHIHAIDSYGHDKEKTVDNGKSITIDLDDGTYTIYVEQGMKSIKQEVEIKSGHTINMKATIIPAPTILLEIIK